jgi:hypothetical protein
MSTRVIGTDSKTREQTAALKAPICAKELFLLNVAQRACIEGRDTSALECEVEALSPEQKRPAVSPEKTSPSILTRTKYKMFKDGRAFLFPKIAQVVFLAFLCLNLGLHFPLGVGITIDVLMIASIGIMMGLCSGDAIKELKNANSPIKIFFAAVNIAYLLAVAGIGIITMGKYLMFIHAIASSSFAKSAAHIALNEILPKLVIGAQIPYLIRGIYGVIKSSILKYKISKAKTVEDMENLVEKELQLQKMQEEQSEEKMNEHIKQQIAQIEELIDKELTTKLLMVYAMKLKRRRVAQIKTLKDEINMQLNKKLAAETLKIAVGAVAIGATGAVGIANKLMVIGSNLLSFITMLFPKYRQVPYIEPRPDIVASVALERLRANQAKAA